MINKTISSSYPRLKLREGPPPSVFRSEAGDLVASQPHLIVNLDEFIETRVMNLHNTITSSESQVLVNACKQLTPITFLGATVYSEIP